MKFLKFIKRLFWRFTHRKFLKEVRRSCRIQKTLESMNLPDFNYNDYIKKYF